MSRGARSVCHPHQFLRRGWTEETGTEPETIATATPTKLATEEVGAGVPLVVAKLLHLVAEVVDLPPLLLPRLVFAAAMPPILAPRLVRSHAHAPGLGHLLRAAISVVALAAQARHHVENVLLLPLLLIVLENARPLPLRIDVADPHAPSLGHHIDPPFLIYLETSDEGDPGQLVLHLFVAQGLGRHPLAHL